MRILAMESSKKVTTFNGKGDVNVFLTKIDLYNQLKNYAGEQAAVSLASRLEEPAFNVYMRMSEEDRKDIEKIKTELRSQYQVGNRDREEALSLLGAAQRTEEETAKDFAFRITELVKLAYPKFDAASQQVHEKDAFVKGCHPDMQMKLKTIENFDALDMKGILDNTVRLEVAGVKSVVRKLKTDMNSVGESGACCSMSCGSGDQILLKRLDSLEETIAKLSVSPNPASSQAKSPTSSSSSRGPQGKKCFNCGEAGHVVRRCPKRFCQSCGKPGHDAWSKMCPKNPKNS